MKKFEVWDPRAQKCVTFKKDLFADILIQDVDGHPLFEGDKVEAVVRTGDILTTYIGVIAYRPPSFVLEYGAISYVELDECLSIKIIRKHGCPEPKEETHGTT